MKRGATNEHLAALIVRLEKTAKANKAPLWSEVARHLSKPHRSMAEVDVARLGTVAPKDASALVVPGVVLGSGRTTASTTVAAWRFTSAARSSISRAGGKALSISELLEANPKGKNIAIVI